MSCTKCGICVVLQSVSSPASNFAVTARGSIAFGMRRWLTIRWLTLTSASLKALSMSPPLTGYVKTKFEPSSS